MVGALLKAVAYTEYTLRKSLFPPPQLVHTEIAKQLDTLELFAYSDPTVRADERQRMNDIVNKVEPPPQLRQNRCLVRHLQNRQSFPSSCRTVRE